MMVLHKVLLVAAVIHFAVSQSLSGHNVMEVIIVVGSVN